MHPRKGAGSPIGTRIKNAFFQGAVSGKTITATFDNYLDEDMESTAISRENYLAAAYQAEKSYFIKVVSLRHLKMHHILTRWRNFVFRLNGLKQPFESFESPEAMVAYEYEATTHTYEKGHSVPEPLKYATLPDSSKAAILFDYVPHSGKLSSESQSLRAYKHIILTLRGIHDGRYVHGTVADHVLQQIPDGKPCLTDTIGAVTDSDAAQLLGVGFDIASLLVRYTPQVGALSAVKITADYYSDIELIAAYYATKAIKWTVPNISSWITQQIRSSINEYVDAAATETFSTIMETAPTETTTNQHPESPYNSEEFITAIETESHTSSDTNYTSEPDADWDDTRLGFHKQ